MTLPLEDIRVIDSANQYPGPYCTMLLGDLGAEIIKVERPGLGDPARILPWFFGSINRNKKSLTLDLKKKESGDILRRLVEKSDVLTEGFRPGVAGKIGLDWEALQKINPRLIYCSISGYGQEGPYRNMPGHDLNYMAMSGMLGCFRDMEGNLVKPGIAIGDLSSGMFAAIGIMAALAAREKTNRGQFVDVSMFDGLVSWMSTILGKHFAKAPFYVFDDPGYGIFRASDGKSFTLGIAHENWFWERLCDVTGLKEFRGLDATERRVRWDELTAELRQVFACKPRKEWILALLEADVPVAPVKAVEEVAMDPHVAFREMIQAKSWKSSEVRFQVNFPIKLFDTPAELRLAPPELGEHNCEILKWLGYLPEEIEKFAKNRVI
ncbi:MAG: CoA transferase [Deltaproteobacteria bacterium]|nr:CoA transferase [Deltaproteobacteria bacterium]